MTTTQLFFHNNDSQKQGRYKLFLKFNALSSRDGVTLRSFDNPLDPLSGYNKLVAFVEKVDRNGHLLIAIIYDTFQGGKEVYKKRGRENSDLD